MRISILANEIAALPNFATEHGFGAFVEYNGARILFDMGASDVFLQNADTLQLDLNQLDYAVLSHAHFDHDGGLLPFITRGNTGFRLLMHQRFFTPKYKMRDELLTYIGSRFTPVDLAQNNVDFALVTQEVYSLPAAEGAYLISTFPRNSAYEHIAADMRMDFAGQIVHDTFAEEMVLALTTPEGVVLVTGCSHSGIENIAEKVRKRLAQPIRAIVGGMHLCNASDTQLDTTAHYFNMHPEMLVYPMHCTGSDALLHIQKNCPSYREAGAGSVIEF
ncbi:MBL fold metallo-hydrolase [Christensenellaceae bacterium OttesenSCG-928-L17]|nr:MBL fold metallo-hydrolase [Christensenellaceae bacterium OttesenSCG-928-L17]